MHRRSAERRRLRRRCGLPLMKCGLLRRRSSHPRRRASTLRLGASRPPRRASIGRRQPTTSWRRWSIGSSLPLERARSTQCCFARRRTNRLPTSHGIPPQCWQPRPVVVSRWWRMDYGDLSGPATRYRHPHWLVQPDECGDCWRCPRGAGITRPGRTDDAVLGERVAIS